MTSAVGSTPVVVGIGQWSERLGESGYEGLSPVDLAARAAQVALDDAGRGGAAITEVDVIACPRQFDESFPGMPAPLGRSDNFPRSVALRLDLDPARVVYEVSGGQSPQHLVTELSGDIAAGRCRIALIVGSEAISTVLDQAQRDAADEGRPDLTESPGGQDGDRGAGLEGLATRYQAGHGLVDAPTQYALFENARRARLGLSRDEHAADLGALFAPFTEVAAANPHSAAPTARSADELMRVTESNRLIVDPYPRYVVSREKVNQAAAVVITSEAVATELGIPREQWVYLRGHSDLHDRELMSRADLSTSKPAVRAVEAALEMAGVALDDVASLDLYSCFPVAVSVVSDALGLKADDPRGLTVTGGLPFFGGPGNNYSLHAIAETVARCRATSGSAGLVGANGGTLSKYSAGVYSTTPGPWQPGHDDRLQATLDAEPGVLVAFEADGWATVETWTVRYSVWGDQAVVIARLDDGRRFLANAVDGDDTVVAALLGERPWEQRVFVRSLPQGNRITLSEERMDELLPAVPVGFRDHYEHVLLHRDGHVLEITINRPESRNALTPEANLELEGVIDAYLADRDLWVAIITGAPSSDGRGAFCSGNDLKATAMGGAMWMPKTGFGGLTSRRNLHKPVIAALNGHAFGGGFEIALACHVVVAEEQAQLALTEVKVGLVAAAGGLVRLPRMLPPHIANEMILTGRRMGAEEARRWGIVNRVAPTGAAMDVAREVAAEILESSPTSVRLSLQLMEEARAHAEPVDALEAPTDALDKLLVARDTTEGVLSFAFKQQPKWRNF